MSEAPPNLMRRALRGMAWSGGSQVVGMVVRMGVAITLARILTPDDYGLAALAVVFASLVLVFSDLALGAAIVQRPELSEDDKSTAFWMSVAAGVVFTALGVAVAHPIADFYGRADVAPLCMVLALTFLITSLATTHEALLVRHMEFGSLERRMMVATVVGAIAAVIVAVITRSAWAIIGQQVAEAIVSTTLLWYFSPWRPRWRFSRKSLNDLGSFSAYLVGHRLLYYFHRNADNLLIGRFIGAAALGAYTIAYNIMLFPFTRIAGPVQKVLGPAFARMQDDPTKLADAWIRAVRLLGTISIPALCGIVVVAHDFVDVVLGPKWAASAQIIQILAWVGIVQSLQSLNTDVLQAIGQPQKVLRFTVVFTGTHFIGFVIGLHWGVIGVATAYAITTTLVEPIYTTMTAHALGTSVWRVLGAVRGVFEAGLLMMAAVWVARHAMLEAGVPTFWRLVISMLVGGVVYLAAYPWRARAGYADIRGIIGGVLARRRSTAVVAG